LRQPRQGAPPLRPAQGAGHAGAAAADLIAAPPGALGTPRRLDYDSTTGAASPSPGQAASERVMALLTTTIGSYPKPDFVMVRDWGHPQSDDKPTHDVHIADLRHFQEKQISTSVFLGTIDAVRSQIAAGIDVPTDGEQGREHYILYHLRHLKGVDYGRLQIKKVRGVEAWVMKVPTIAGKIEPQGRFLRYDWQVAQKIAGDRHPVKITLPGPMTIADTVVDEHYGSEIELNRALAEALNVEVRDLAKAGCKWIQVDEPLFPRYPDKALAYGIENLDRCFAGLPGDVNRVVHLCCGFPRKLDDPDPPKADHRCYFALAEALDQASVDAVSIEDAHRHNDLVERMGSPFDQIDVAICYRIKTAWIDS